MAIILIDAAKLIIDYRHILDVRQEIKKTLKSDFDICVRVDY